MESYSYKPVAVGPHVDRHSESKEPGPRFGVSIRKILLVVSLFFNFLCLTFILKSSNTVTEIFSPGPFFGDGKYSGGILETEPPNTSSKGRIEKCTSSQVRPPRASPPAPVNLWALLTESETTQIESWLEDPERNLNLTRSKHSVVSDNVIFLIEAYAPPKADALVFLDSQNASSCSPPKLPERYARVTIHHGGWKEPVVKDYLVGPLPVGVKTAIKPLLDIYHREDIPFNARALFQLADLSIFLAKEIKPLMHAMEVSDAHLILPSSKAICTNESVDCLRVVPQELFGGTIRGDKNDTLVAGATGPFSFDGSFRRLWMTWRRNTAGSYILPVNFYQYIDMSGSDPSQWKILKVHPLSLRK